MSLSLDIHSFISLDLVDLLHLFTEHLNECFIMHIYIYWNSHGISDYEVETLTSINVYVRGRAVRPKIKDMTIMQILKTLLWHDSFLMMI